MAGLHSIVLEPVIDRAITLEERTATPVVGRPVQRVGLVAGFLVFGASWGLLYGLGFVATRPWQPPWSDRRRAFLGALATGWTVSVFPFLKYPANPPGVGQPETIGYRQALYVGFIGLSVAGSALAIWLHRRVNRRPRMGTAGRVLGAAGPALYTLYALVVYAGMPSGPDPVRLPAELLWTFRGISLAALVLFWMMLGGLLGWLLRRDSGPKVR